MSTPSDVVIDTMVVRGANAKVEHVPREHSLFASRTRVLRAVLDGRIRAVISAKLVAEYTAQIKVKKNDAVRQFFALLAVPNGRQVYYHWKQPWLRTDRAKAKECRFPFHDQHLLRTAATPEGSTIITEEKLLLKLDACTHREFKVHVRGL